MNSVPRVVIHQVVRYVSRSPFQVAVEYLLLDFSAAPADTEWFNGNCGSNPGALSYEYWGDAIEWYPPGNLDVPLCLHLITDNLYYEVVVYQWTIGDIWGEGPGGGGFAYYRKKV